MAFSEKKYRPPVSGTSRLLANDEYRGLLGFQNGPGETLQTSAGAAAGALEGALEAPEGQEGEGLLAGLLDSLTRDWIAGRMVSDLRLPATPYTRITRDVLQTLGAEALGSRLDIYGRPLQPPPQTSSSRPPPPPVTRGADDVAAPYQFEWRKNHYAKRHGALDDAAFLSVLSRPETKAQADFEYAKDKYDYFNERVTAAAEAARRRGVANPYGDPEVMMLAAHRDGAGTALQASVKALDQAAAARQRATDTAVRSGDAARLANARGFNPYTSIEKVMRSLPRAPYAQLRAPTPAESLKARDHANEAFVRASRSGERKSARQ